MGKYSLYVMLLCLFSSQVFAVCNEYRCTGKIDTLYLRDLNSVFITMDQDETVLNCALYGNKYITLNGEHQNADRIYSALLTAKTTNTDVTLRIVQNSTNCEIDYIVVE